MSASVCDYVIFRLTNIVFSCTMQFKISNTSINDYSTNIKTKTCSAPTEPSCTMRPETKKQSRFETHLDSVATASTTSDVMNKSTLNPSLC